MSRAALSLSRVDPAPLPPATTTPSEAPLSHLTTLPLSVSKTYTLPSLTETPLGYDKLFKAVPVPFPPATITPSKVSGAHFTTR